MDMVMDIYFARIYPIFTELTYIGVGGHGHVNGHGLVVDMMKWS